LKNIKNFDYQMFGVISILLCIGLIILASASSYSALQTYSDSNYFLIRQLRFWNSGFYMYANNIKNRL
jgi:cell division protein FtsW (lipid II flippase)